MLSINGWMAKMINQPINTYMSVDNTLYLPVKNSFKTIPLKAIPQVMPNIVQPVAPFRVTSVNGV